MPELLVRKLEHFTPLSDIEKQIAMRAPVRVRRVSAGQDIVSDGSQPTDVSLLSEGFACRYRLLGAGRRQITALLIPGDICDLRALLLSRMDEAVAALTSCHIAVIPHQKLREMIERHPRLGFTLWADTMLDAAIYSRWLTDIGRLPAHARIAHLICELFVRMKAIGRADHGSFELPLTQTDIGDAMGLSTVHVNRTLQQLRAEGLIKLRSNVLVVRDWQGLRAAAEFDPSYLLGEHGRRPRTSELA